MRTKNFLISELAPGVVESLLSCAEFSNKVVIVLDKDSPCYQEHYGVDLDDDANLGTVTTVFSEEEQEVLRLLDQPSDGLGDTLTKAFHKMGVDKATNLFTKITGLSCGCSWRRKLLNEVFPYKRN